MATTTNYSWETPDDTDLVKDGAAAIRTLGSSIDTTTKALNPSTTLGDIEYRSSTANTNTRLGIGSTGQVLTVAGGVPSWATPASTTPTFVGCYLQRSANQSIANNTVTSVTWDTETLDTDAFHSTSTNTDRITIPSGKAGKYMVGFTLTYTGTSTGIRVGQIRKNGTSVSQTNVQSVSGNGNTVLTKTHVINLAVGDYLDLQAYQNSGGNLDLLTNAADIDLSAFYAYYLGA